MILVKLNRGEVPDMPNGWPVTVVDVIPEGSNPDDFLAVEDLAALEAFKATLPPPAPKYPPALYVSRIQEWMDAEARRLGYDDIKAAVTYAEEPSVPKFQEEGQKFRALRSLVWADCYALLASPPTPAPTPEELVSTLKAKFADRIP